MAATDAGTALTEGHRLAQARLGAQTVRLLRSSWPLLDPNDLDRTAPGWLRVTVPLVTRQRRLSARLAAQYLQAFRAVEIGVDGEYRPLVGEFDDLRALTTSLLVTGPVRVKQQMRRQVPLVRALSLAEAASAAAAMRHALNGGRDVLVNSVRADRMALGWARVVSGDPCAFCAMLASRGPVYGEDTADFQAHDRCSCTAEPVYRADAPWPPGSERYRDLWRQAKTEDGDTTANFRRLVEAA